MASFAQSYDEFTISAQTATESKNSRRLLIALATRPPILSPGRDTIS